MKQLLYYLFLLYLGSATYANLNRIFGGNDAHEGQFPYHISLRVRGSFSCSGSIIADTWILTAAHCVLGRKAEDMTVVAGTNLLGNGGDTYKIKKFIPHSSYKEQSHPWKTSNDIALIQLEEKIKTNKNVQKIKLATADTPGGTKLVFSGWGDTFSWFHRSLIQLQFPNKLQTIELISIDNKECSEAHYPFAEIESSQICTFTKAGEGACYGDSGGPLVASGRQVGIASWVVPCAKGVPDVFTSVYSYLDWIEEHME